MQDIYFKKIKGAVGRAIADFSLIEEGDRIAIGISGGKDSYTLLHVLDALRQRAPVRYELVPVTIDAGFPGFNRDLITEHLSKHRFVHHMEITNHYEIIQHKLRPDSSFCSFCARLKRGALYGFARSNGCNKLALGHHLDDFIETLLLNQFFVGSLKAMAPSMLADDGITTVIRPLVYVAEEDISHYAARHSLPVVTCSCPVAGSTDHQRQKMKALLTRLQEDIPGIKKSLLRSLANVHPRHLLDPSLKKIED